MEKLNTDNIRLSAEGVWLHDDVEITHQRTVEMLFKSILVKNGKYFLSGEKKPVPFVVDDVAFFVKGISEKNGGLVLKLSDDSQETLVVSTLDIGPDNQFYCFIKSGSVKAKFERKVYYELMKKLDQRDGYYGLVLQDKFYPVQSVSQIKENSPGSGESPAKKVAKKSAKKIKAKKILKKAKKKIQRRKR